MKIARVDPGSEAEALGLAAGDELLSVDENELNDSLDYDFYTDSKSFHLKARVADGIREWDVQRTERGPFGCDFQTYLGDQKHSCSNHCMFCFIDQLPPGMRESLYFKDDDERLSFLFGNYITMTNMQDHEIERIIKMHISPINISVHTTNPQLRVRMLANKRGGEVLVPNGHFVPQAGDRVYAIGTPTETARVLRSMGRDTSPIRQLSVIGGGRIALYLAWALDGMGMHITIVEQNEEKCMAIAEKLPKATILHGDGTDHDLLESEGIFDADAFVSLTGRDEENLLMALTAKDSGVAKVLPKMSRPNYTALVHDLGIDTVISPKDVTASQISSYVRGLANSQGSAVESLHKILGGAMEAVEFTATGATHFLNTPLKDLNFKPGLLVAAIVHGGKLLIPGGHSIISEGDRVIVVAKSLFLKDLNDILVR